MAGAAAGTKREVERLRAEVDRLKDENRRLMQVAYRDPLTGLRNRRFFNERLGEELCRLRREPDRVCSVIMVDLNAFKALNDTRGHAAGDAALVAVGHYLESLTRTTDLCCRVGGDEFIVLLPNTDVAQCQRVLQRLRAYLPRLATTGLGQRGLSLGAATATASDDELRLLSRADELMYADKREARGGSAVEVCDEPEPWLARAA